MCVIVLFFCFYFLSTYFSLAITPTFLCGLRLRVRVQRCTTTCWKSRITFKNRQTYPPPSAPLNVTDMNRYGDI